MRVLIIHEYGTLTGGAEHMSSTLRQGLRIRGHTVDWFSSTARPQPVPIEADHTCFGTRTALRHVTQVANPHAVVRLRDVLRRVRPDVVHCRMFMSQLSPLILPLLRDVPAVLHVVNYNYVCPLNTKRLPDGAACHDRPGVACWRHGCMPVSGVLRATVQYALWERWRSVFDAIVANSHWVRRRLVEEGLPVDDVVWNGVPTTPARPPLSDPPVVGFAGRLVPKKGVDLLLRAMVRVVRQRPEARLLIVGDGPERARLQDLALELGIAGAVEWLGHLPRAEGERVLQRAWVQVVPSLWEEPFGLVAAEAGMRGTAAIVSDHGGPAEIVEEGVTGYRYPPADDSALAAAILRVLSDRDLAERLGAAGRARALSDFTEDKAVDRFEAIYARLTAGRAPAPPPAITAET